MLVDVYCTRKYNFQIGKRTDHGPLNYKAIQGFNDVTIRGKSINNLRYADGTVLITENEND
jgi:hypothetical protein